MSDFSLKIYESVMNNLYLLSLETSAKESAHVSCLIQKVRRGHCEMFGL